MFRLRSLGALIALFGAGIAAALVQSTSAQVPLPTLTSTTVTLTTPTLPPPLPPPTTATVTAPLPQPPPPPSAPITSAVTSVTQPLPTTSVLPAPSEPPSSSSPTGPTTGGGAGTSSGGGGGSSSSSSSGGGGSSSGGGGGSSSSSGSSGGSNGGLSSGFGSSSPGTSSSDRAPERRLHARTDRSGKRVAVRLEFVLPGAQRLFLIVRGPAPSCRVVGVVPVRGRAGENVVRFAGRVRGRLLERGVYRLTLSSQRRVVPGAHTELVRVAGPRRTVPLPDSVRMASCASAAALAADPEARLLAAEEEQAEAAPAQAAPGRPARPVAPLRPPLAIPGTGEPQSGFADFIPEGGSLAPADDDGVGGAAMFAVVVVIGLLLLTMLALVTRFLRGTWDP